MMIKFISIFLGFTLALSGITSAETFEFGIIGDAGQKGPSLSMIQTSLRSSSVRRLILPGDNLYSGAFEDVWDSWLSFDFEFSVVALGNHPGKYEKEISYFKSKNGRVFPNNSEYYAAAFGSKDEVVFFVLNSDNKKNVSEQLNWLDTQLNKSNAKFNFLVYHHPTYTVSKKHQWAERAEFQLKIREILKIHQKKVTALLLGHDHIAAVYKFNGLPAIISGATHASRGEGNVKDSYVDENGVKVDQIWRFDGAPHWVRLVMDTNENTAFFQMIRATNINGKATLPDRAPTFSLPEGVQIAASREVPKDRKPAKKPNQ